MDELEVLVENLEKSLTDLKKLIELKKKLELYLENLEVLEDASKT